MYKSIIHMQHT